MRKSILFKIFLVILPGLLFYQIMHGQAGVSGHVLSDAGKPVAGAKVFYQRYAQYLSVRPPGTNTSRLPGRPVQWVLADPPIQGVIATSADGTFALPHLPDGKYTICIVSPGPGFLDSCTWTGAIIFSVNQDRAPAVADLRLKTGTEIHVRINDPLQLGRAKKNAAIPLIVGVLINEHIFHAAPIVSEDSTGRDHSISVPLSTPLKLWLFSRTLKVTDSSANPITIPGHAVPFQAAVGTSRLDYVFNIAGVQ